MKKIKTIFLFAVTVFFFMACKKETNSATCPPGKPDPNCVCPTFYKPVCGCDKITYDNACSAICAGITTYTDGKCP